MDVLVDDVIRHILTQHCNMLDAFLVALTCKRHFFLLTAHRPWEDDALLCTEKNNWVINPTTEGCTVQLMFEYASWSLLKRTIPYTNFDLRLRPLRLQRAWQNVPRTAAIRGDVDIFGWLMSEEVGPMRSAFVLDTSVADEAAQRGHVKVLQWLRTVYHPFVGVSPIFSPNIFERGCISGNLAMLKWMIGMIPVNITSESLRTVIKYGHLNVLRYFHSIGYISPLDTEIQWAIEFKQDAIHAHLLNLKEILRPHALH